MRPVPGQRVIITQNLFDSMIPHHCYAPKGSIARALSFEEYCEGYENNPSSFLYYSEYIEKWMKTGEQFPFVLEYIAPLDPNEVVTVIYKSGLGIVLGEKDFKILEDWQNKLLVGQRGKNI